MALVSNRSHIVKPAVSWCCSQGGQSGHTDTFLGSPTGQTGHLAIVWLSSMHREPGSLRSEREGTLWLLRKRRKTRFPEVAGKCVFPFCFTQLRCPLVG